MRATGVQLAPAGPVSKATRKRASTLWLGLLVFAASCAIGGYIIWGRRPPAGEPGDGGPLTLAALHDTLKAANVVAGELEHLLVADVNVERFAKAAAGAQATAQARAQAINAAIRARASALAFVPWSLGEPRVGVLNTNPQTLAVLAKDKGRAELYPLELAALEVAALRSLGVTAMLAELISLDKERAPLDPSGYLGYFVVAVYPGEAAIGAPHLFDPYGGRELPTNSKHNVLSDPRAVGVALATRALHEVTYLADLKRGLTSSSYAIQLAGTLPSVRTVRAMVVLAGRQVEQGLSEFSAARQLRGDAPRLHNVASIELMTGEVERALNDVHAALALAPDFAGVHATLGSLALVRGELGEAQSELDQAEKLAPDLSLVQWARAELKLREGERDAALALARRALAARPSFDARVRMGVLLRQMARFDELREQAKQLLAMTPSYRQSEVRELLGSVLGPAAFDPDARDPEAEAEAAQAPNIALPEPTPAPVADPSTQAPAPGEPRPYRRPEPSFQLRGANDQLQLNLAR
ncbi:MAG: hypothetical protein JWN04_6611 [Myxococcaceae bacterium]|nr:hypothetical protein [Myxococcaceae bacterium]